MNPMTSVVRLRPWRDDDVVDLLDAFSGDPDMVSQGGLETVDDARAWLKFAQVDPRLSGLPQRLVFAIEVDGRPRGSVGITEISALDRNGWTWYWMHRAYRGHGWTAQSVATVATWALTVRHLELLELRYRTDQPASAAVALAAGFIPSGEVTETLLLSGEFADAMTAYRRPGDPRPRLQELPLALL